MRDIQAGEVAEYLLRHPDFFQVFPELLEQLQVPDPRHGRAVSLMERQVQRLRETKRHLEEEVGALLAVAGDNDRLFQKMHRLHLALMAARTDETFVAVLLTHLTRIFTLDQVRLISFEVPQEVVPGILQLGLHSEWHQLLKQHLPLGQPRCGSLDAPWQSGLFQAKPAIESVCLIPLGNYRQWGVLALGSCEAARFSPALDTFFLKLLGELVSARLGHLFSDVYTAD